MKRLGVDVRVVDDAWAALKEFKTDPESYAVLVAHVALSGIGSRELVRQLRRLRPSLPIVFLGIPPWRLGSFETALELPLSPAAIRDAITTMCPDRPTRPGLGVLRLTG